MMSPMTFYRLTVRLDKRLFNEKFNLFSSEYGTTFLISSRHLIPLPVLEAPSTQPRLKISVCSNKEKSPGGDLATMDEIARGERKDGAEGGESRVTNHLSRLRPSSSE